MIRPSSSERSARRSSNVFIICGAAGSGKSTYVQQHKGTNDIVFDFDCICAALMGTSEIHGNHELVLSVAISMREVFYRCVEMHKGKWEKAWIITTSTDGDMLKNLAQRLKAEIVLMPATLDECIEHINNDPDRPNKRFHIGLARKWFAEWGAPSRKTTGIYEP